MMQRQFRTAGQRLWHLLLFVVVGMLAAPFATAAAKPEMIPAWNGSDEASTLSIDHSGWQELLDGYLKPHPSGITRFDYGGLQASAEATAKLADYLTYLQGLDPRTYSRAEQMPYWINFYNALTVQVVADEYPVDSIRNIHDSILPFPTGPWGDVHAEVAGMELTLDNIEHGILRPIWADPRIHYAVNCASIGCPNLAAAAYTPANVEALLEAGARDYVNHPRGVDIVDADFMVLSSIYDWWILDFGDSEEGVMEHLIRYAEPELAAGLETFAGDIDYEYDWNLNQP